MSEDTDVGWPVVALAALLMNFVRAISLAARAPRIAGFYVTFEDSDTRRNRKFVPYAAHKSECFGTKLYSYTSNVVNIFIYVVAPAIVFTTPLHQSNPVWLIFNWAWLAAPFVASVAIISLTARTAGRLCNASFMNFASYWERSGDEPVGSDIRKDLLSAYEIVDFKRVQPHFISCQPVRYNGLIKESKLIWPLCTLSTVFVKTVGVRLLYPGCMSTVHAVLAEYIDLERIKHMTHSDCHRLCIQTANGHKIDGLLCDRRPTDTEADRGILVIVCEGNSSFYEISAIQSFKKLHNIDGCQPVSFIVWNHPGFGSSEGLPFPDQEVAAGDSLVQYAIHSLGFAPSEIVLWAWSIGGFVAAWLASEYPELKAVVLDASFDHILPLALANMPRILSPVVSDSIGRFANLDVMAHIRQFHGPIRIIRRLRDPVISTDHTKPLHVSNRGNWLLRDVLSHRYPVLFSPDRAELQSYGLAAVDTGVSSASCDDVLLEFLHSIGDEREALVEHNMLPNVMERMAAYHKSEYTFASRATFGSDLTDGEKIQLALFLISSYLTEFDLDHCDLLAPPALHLPDPITDIRDGP